MSLLGTLAKLASIAGAVERAGSAISSAVRSLRRLPRPKHADPPMPLRHIDAETQRRASHGHMASEGTRSWWCKGPTDPHPCARCRLKLSPSGRYDD